DCCRVHGFVLHAVVDLVDTLWRAVSTAGGDDGGVYGRAVLIGNRPEVAQVHVHPGAAECLWRRWGNQRVNVGGGDVTAAADVVPGVNAVNFFTAAEPVDGDRPAVVEHSVVLGINSGFVADTDGV